MQNKNLPHILTISLGGLWLLDGILQLQPAMFTAAFVQQVLAPNLPGQPSLIAAIINFGISIWNLNPFGFNILAAGIQLLIGVLLIIPFVRRGGDHANITAAITKFALWLSVAWALIIWIFGEGFGLLATGSATFYTGAPGSALLYAILAVFLLYGSTKLEKLPIAAGIIFLVGAALQLAPMFWQPTIVGNLLSFVALAALGIFLICMPRSRTVAWFACALLIAVWWIGQSFGGIFSFPGGTATDPNSAAVLVLFLVVGMMKLKSTPKTLADR